MKNQTITKILGVPSLKCITNDIIMIMDLPPIAFSIESILPKGVHILVSDSNIAKSWLVLDMCSAIANGEDLFRFKATEGDVLFLTLDDTMPRVARRLHDYTKEVEINAGKIHFALGAFEHGTYLPYAIEDFIKEMPTTKLVVIDTSGYAKYFTKDYTKTTYIEDLRKVAHENDISVVIVQDTHNTLHSDKLHWISGGAKLSSDVDGVWVLEKDKYDENKGELTIISNDTPDFSIGVKLNSSNLTKDEEIS